MIGKTGRKIAELFVKTMLKYWKSEYEAWANNYRRQRERDKTANMKGCELKMEYYAGWILTAQNVTNQKLELDIPEGAFTQGQC